MFRDLLPITVGADLTIGIDPCGVRLTPAQGMVLGERLIRMSMRRTLIEEAERAHRAAERAATGKRKAPK